MMFLNTSLKNTHKISSLFEKKINHVSSTHIRDAVSPYKERYVAVFS